jgi:hypothetical protein
VYFLWWGSPNQQLNSQSHIATDSKSISKSWCQVPSGPHDQIFITLWQLRSCFCGAPSLTRGRFCLLCMLLAFASVIFVGSESLGTCGHILLSQIWDFPLCRLLQLAGSQWRYSTPPPHRHTNNWTTSSGYITPAQTAQKTSLPCSLIDRETCSQSRSLAVAAVLSPFYTAVTWQRVCMSQYVFPFMSESSLQVFQSEICMNFLFVPHTHTHCMIHPSCNLAWFLLKSIIMHFSPSGRQEDKLFGTEW